MGGKLGKHNTYVVSGGAQGVSYTSNIDQEEDRRDSEGSLYFSGHSIPQLLVTQSNLYSCR